MPKGKKGKKPFARKRFGQHFLNSQSIIDQIVSCGSIGPDDHIIEIGPGRGALTRPLALQGCDLTIVELDWDLVESLKTTYGTSRNVAVIEGDILKLDWETILKEGQSNKIVANLPYNISTPVFFKMVAHRHRLDAS